MKLKFKIETSQDYDKLRRQIAITKFQMPQFQAVLVRKLANEIIVDTIHRRMRANAVSEKIITNTTLENIEFTSAKKVRLYFKSEYFSETGFDVALAREKGTRRHKVEPRTKQALRWIQLGIVKFSKGHEVDGMVALNTIANVLDEMESVLQDSYNLEFFAWLNKNLGGTIAI